MTDRSNEDHPNTQDPSSRRIAALNDALRTTFNPAAGRIVMTRSIAALPAADRSAIFDLVKTFNAFTPDNDPYSEHDFGVVTYDGMDIHFKIDYYDKSVQWGSPDPSDEECTTRVMTIMLAHER